MLRILRHLLGAVVLLALPLAATAEGLAPDFHGLESRLRLAPAQRALFDDAVAATRRAMLATGLAALDGKGRLDQELRRARPDVGRLLAEPQDLIEQVAPQWREAREAWSAFYATLDARQAAIARDYVERSLGAFDDAASLLLRDWRERLRP